MLNDHRRHRLGMLLKLTDLRQLATRFPDHCFVESMNVEDNRHMLDVNAPLAVYGDLDSATLNLAAGPPPAAVLCGTLTSGGPRQHGSATWTSGPLAYLFSKVNPTKVSTGGGYYWIAGAVDSTAGHRRAATIFRLR